jgi:hypothetical protein
LFLPKYGLILSVGGVTTQTLGYTADGRMAAFNPGIESPGSQCTTSLSYNQDAQLAAVNASNGALASYTYDGFGQRLFVLVGLRHRIGLGQAPAGSS